MPRYQWQQYSNPYIPTNETEISSSSPRLDMTLAVAEALSPNKPTNLYTEGNPLCQTLYCNNVIFNLVHVTYTEEIDEIMR